MDLDLAGRRALVTGGGGGIGKACTERLAAAGAHVVVLDLDLDRARAVADAVGGEPLAVDLADTSAVDALDASDVGCDVLVNCAGFQHVAPIAEFAPEVFDRMLRVMVHSPFRLVRKVLPGMAERGWGRIVTISSVHGLRASPYKIGYVTAKHALEGMSKVIALEGAAAGVTSNCVDPAYVRTPLVEDQIADQARMHGMPPDDVVEQVMLARAAIRRLIEPSEVAELVASLCSPAASMMTGPSLSLDGGWTAY